MRCGLGGEQAGKARLDGMQGWAVLLWLRGDGNGLRAAEQLPGQQEMWLEGGVPNLG